METLNIRVTHSGKIRITLPNNKNIGIAWLFNRLIQRKVKKKKAITANKSRSEIWKRILSFICSIFKFSKVILSYFDKSS